MAQKPAPVKKKKNQTWEVRELKSALYLVGPFLQREETRFFYLANILPCNLRSHSTSAIPPHEDFLCLFLYLFELLSVMNLAMT